MTAIVDSDSTRIQIFPDDLAGLHLAGPVNESEYLAPRECLKGSVLLPNYLVTQGVRRINQEMSD